MSSPSLSREPFDRVKTKPPEPTPLPSLRVARGAIQDVECDAVVVNLFDGVSVPGGATGAVDDALGGALTELIAAGQLPAKLGKTTMIASMGRLRARWVIVVGLGDPDSFDPESVRRAAAAAARRAADAGIVHLATVAHGAGIGGIDPATSARATLEGGALAAYEFAGWRNSAKVRGPTELTIAEVDDDKARRMQEGLRIAEATVRGAYLARDLANTPANVATPEYLAAAAKGLEASGLEVTVGDAAWAAQHGMGLFLAVARGSEVEPRFLVMEHRGDDEGAPPVVLVGKGVTFDTGGYSLKTKEGMVPMKGDMSGAAAVIGAMSAIAGLGLDRRVVGICACVENMVDAGSYRPSDVIVGMDGTSVEVISTDAEGRLALADALAFAKRYRPAAVVDIATLTGASVVAMGAGVSASLFSNDDGLASELERAASASGERVWRMPLFPEYRKAVESKVADLKNSGGPRGGLGTAASFLEAFTDYPWAHVDMAGMEQVERTGERGYLPPGATGFGVRLLVDMLLGTGAPEHRGP